MAGSAPPRRAPCAGVRRTALLALLFGCLWALPQPGAAREAEAGTTTGDEPTLLERRPGTGERCLVRGEPVVGEEVVELRYRGRRATVAAAMLDRLQADPDRYFARLEARSGLFDERAVGPTGTAVVPLGPWPFRLGLVILAGLLTGALTGALAVARGRSPLAWFFAGLLGSLIATAVLLSLPRRAVRGAPEGIPSGFAKVAVTRAPIPCPKCGAPLHPTARRCPKCGTALDPPAPSEAARR